jgi:hypothetical protein
LDARFLRALAIFACTWFMLSSQKSRSLYRQQLFFSYSADPNYGCNYSTDN